MRLWSVVALAVVGVLAGTLVGERLLLGMSRERFLQVVSIAVGLLGLWVPASSRLSPVALTHRVGPQLHFPLPAHREGDRMLCGRALLGVREAGALSGRRAERPSTTRNDHEEHPCAR
jgi:hypothetical protein